MVEDDKPSSSNTEKLPLHPAFTANNVHLRIRTLDGKKTPYSNWVKLFRNHLKIYKLLPHIDGTTPPSEEDPSYESWAELDALILQWIYSTVADDVCRRILDEPTSRKAWLQIQEIFLNNKHARAATLEQQFTNTTLASSASFDEYCQTLKDLANQLADVQQPVSESRLVIQMVRGLPAEYDTVGAIINQQTPTWDQARGMVEAEQQRQAARRSSSRDAALAATQNPTRPPTNSDQQSTSRSPYPNGYRGNNYDPAKAARGGRGGQGKFSGRGGGRFNGAGAPWNFQAQVPNSNYASGGILGPRPTPSFVGAGSHQWAPPTPFPSLPAHVHNNSQAQFL